MKPDERRGIKYAFETRRIKGVDAHCVLLDSVQSQANRMEEALEALWASESIALPVIAVDFSLSAPDVGMVTSLSAPHRVADALLRDSLNDGTFSPVGHRRSFTDATAKNAAPLFKVCPTGLVFGLWDSTGPKGGLGSKFARALVSEIVGVGAKVGSKTSSRIDPASIITNAGPVFIAKELGPDGKPTWTLNVMDAKPLKEDKPPKDDQDTSARANFDPSPPFRTCAIPQAKDKSGGAYLEEGRGVLCCSIGERSPDVRQAKKGSIVQAVAQKRIGNAMRRRQGTSPCQHPARKVKNPQR